MSQSMPSTPSQSGARNARSLFADWHIRLAAFWLMLALIALTAWYLRFGVPWYLFAYFSLTFASSLVAFVAYGIDKWQAQQDRSSRISEKRLHMLEACGGWPGAIVAQHLFRHKTQKSSYQKMFWTIVWLHIVVVTLVVVIY